MATMATIAYLAKVRDDKWTGLRWGGKQRRCARMARACRDGQEFKREQGIIYVAEFYEKKEILTYIRR